MRDEPEKDQERGHKRAGSVFEWICRVSGCFLRFVFARGKFYPAPLWVRKEVAGSLAGGQRAGGQGGRVGAPQILQKGAKRTVRRYLVPVISNKKFGYQFPS